jgi:capsular polysaccharide transport system ATP-binding protein
MIEVINVTKWYPTRKGPFMVIRDLNVTFKEGQSVGILGRNGVGKSTLLRLLGGLDIPNKGEIRTNKTISWPVGGANIKATLTGRENTLFIATIYGYKGKFAKQVIDFVQEFADIGDFFDLPVKAYSSGMKSRLAFGISMAFEFDYYLIDEAFAAGDPSFRAKCDALMAEKRKTSQFLIVSHAMGPISSICDVGLVLERGKITCYDNIKDAIYHYKTI